MVDFRKWLPALAIVALLLGTTVMANAQPAFTCQVSTGVTPLVRGEGLAELVGDVVLLCSGGIPTAPNVKVPGVNFAIFLNTNITSRVLGDGVTEALLMIDDPAPAQQIECPPLTVGGCPIMGTGTGVDYKTSENPNVWAGNLVQAGGQEYLAFNGIPLDPPTTNAIRTVRITNIRANANRIGVSSTLLPSQIVAFISITSSSSISIPNPQQTVAFVSHGLGDVSLSATPSFAACVGHTTSEDPSFLIKVTEGYASAFKRLAIGGLSDATATGNGSAIVPAVVAPPDGGIPQPAANWHGTQPNLDNQNTPGQVAFTESGFVNDAFAYNGIIPGAADQGTRLLVSIGNIPAGVTLYAGSLEWSANGDPLYSRIRLISTSSTDGSGSFTAINTQLVKITSAGVLTYEVTTDDPTVVESLQIPIWVTYKANEGGLTPADALPTVGVSLAPTSTVGTESSPDGNGLAVPRFKDTTNPMTAFQINPCQTNILFPWVVNQDGFDTGIAIANTSADPYDTVNQTGNCTINYYGETTGGGAAPNPQTTTDPIAAGSVLRFVVSTGGTNGIAGTPGFLGYVIAKCDFQYAHGFAFITDGPIGQAHVAEGYLGLILDKKLYNSRPGLTNQSESLNQ
jgi:hypothetical protein